MNLQERINLRLSVLAERLPGLYATFKEKYQRRLLIFLFFILLAFIFWFIRALNETYVAEISYPVKYSKLPENKILVGNLPKKLTLKVQATGLKIFMHQIHLNINALRFNVESFSMRESKNNSFYILTNQVKEFLAEDLENIRILSISPDTLFFHFVDVVTRKVAVKVVIKDPENLLAKQYALNGAIYTVPDSIIATGAESVLDTIRWVNTRAIDLSYLVDSTDKSVALVTIRQLNYNREKVRVYIPVDKYTETTEVVPIVPVNVPDSLVMKTFPGTVRISYRITLSNYDKVNPDMFIPAVDYNSIDRSLSSKLKVMLLDTPKYVYDVRVNPGNVDYINELNVENRSYGRNRQR